MSIAVSELDDGIVSLLIRMRSFTAQLSLNQPRLRIHTDLPFLRAFWSCSSEVLSLGNYLVEHPHEAAAVLTFQRREVSGTIRGRLDACQTTVRQCATGNPSLFVSHEATRSFDTGLNHLLVWVVEEARRLSREFLRTVQPESAYVPRFERAAGLLNQACRLDSIRMAAAQLDVGQRPAPNVISQAKRSRARVYQLAAEALIKLVSIEQGHEEQIRSLLQETLLGPLEPWRRFELFVVLAMGESLSRALGLSCDLSPAFARDGSLVKVGRYRVLWQSLSEYFSPPVPEPSEVTTNKILASLGMGAGWDRPDVLVVDSLANEVVSIAEVKYFAGEESDGRSAIRSAVEQLVRYTRGYRAEKVWDDLLTHSLVVPLRSAFATAEHGTIGVPWVVDFSAIKSGEIDRWSRALIAASKIFSGAEPLAA